MEIGATKAVQERLKATKISEIKENIACVLLGYTFGKNKEKKCTVYSKCQQSLYNSNDRY